MNVEKLKLVLRAECYTARRAIRSTIGADKWLSRYFKSNGTPPASATRVRRLVEILPPLLAQECVAKAEALAIDQLVKEVAQ